MIPVVVIRPQPGCARTVAQMRDNGLDAHGFALFRIDPRHWQPPDAADFDAILLGSANALRHAGPALADYAGKPAYAVGAATARAAADAGLDTVAIGSGGLQSLLERLRPGDRRLLRLAGEARVALDPPHGITIAERIVYAGIARPIPPALAALLRAPALVLLHSAEAARHFAAECGRMGIARGGLSLAALGPRIADAAGPGWNALKTADTPCERTLLALAARMCDDAAVQERISNLT